MSIFGKLFGQKKSSNIEVFSRYAIRSLNALNKPVTDANKLKITVYLCFAQLACLHTIANGKANVFLDKMVEDAKDSILELKMKVEELANDDDELNRILSDFPDAAGVTGDTLINGLAAWDAVYLTYVYEVVPEMNSSPYPPITPFEHPALIVHQAMMGMNPKRNNAKELESVITEMTGEVIRAFR